MIETVTREERALAYVLRDADAFGALLDVLKPDYIEHPFYAVIYRLARPLYKKLKRPPTRDELLALVSSRLPVGEPVETLAGVTAAVDHLYTLDVTEASYLEVAEYVALRELTGLADTVSAGEGDVVGLLEQARSVVDRIEPLVSARDATKLIYPLRTEYLEKLLEVDDDEEVISTGYPSIDSLLRNRGMGRGELMVVMAPTNAGKSHILLNFTANFVEQGLRVAYFTLDDTQTEVDRRFLGRASRVGLDRPYTKQERHEALLEWMRERNINPNNLVLTSLVAERLTVGTIRGYVGMMERDGGPVDVIVVDYGDLLEASNPQEKHHLRLGDVFEGLRRMGKLHNALVLTATQTNRDGLEQEILSLKKVAEGYIKTWPAALWLALCQTPTEMAMEPPRCRLAALKNKRGRVGVELPFIADWGNADLREDPEGRQRNIAKVLAEQLEREKEVREDRESRRRNNGKKSSQDIDSGRKSAVEWDRPQRKYQAYPADGDAPPEAPE